MDVQKYLNRIGSTVPAEPDLDALRSVHTLHLLSVPFEDLTVHSGGRVELDLPLIYDKIVTRHRGGFCYENNGLFSWLLCSLGFQVTMLSAQVKGLISGYYGPPFDHLVLMVTLQGRRWLCDVGFGGAGFSVPISLETSGPQAEGHRVYRIRKQGDMHFLEWQGEENRGADGDWKEVYKFTLDPQAPGGLHGHVPVPPELPLLHLLLQIPLHHFETRWTAHMHGPQAHLHHFPY
ncbi:unnamed protein product [Pleuronectes platessa]|uniref:arylamine N-acetyltransferase n=1 Tax=Pleuronectes platessa TaxID=8262 RepID=A0A9N7W1C1_PLEPL|nr:unnamed protein product [Pleuronectes platessa]